MGKLNLRKRVTMIGIGNNMGNNGSPSHSPNLQNESSLNSIKLNRLKSLSVYSQPNQYGELKAPLSPLKLRRRGNTIVEQPDIKISLK